MSNMYSERDREREKAKRELINPYKSYTEVPRSILATFLREEFLSKHKVKNI